MEISSEISRLRDYFTLTDNEIICDICSNPYDIIINTEEVREHLIDHDGYQNAVSSKSSQEDLKKFYTIENNTIKCKFCNEKLYIPWNTHSIIKYHLQIGHNTGKNEMEVIRKWISAKYKLDESDGKQHCNECNEIIQNKPIFLINHLDIVHNDKRLHLISYYWHSNKLDRFFDNWIWDYFIRNEEIAECSICNMPYNYVRKYTNIKRHMEEMHKDKVVSSKKSIKCYYSQIQDYELKCNICNNVFKLNIDFINKNMEKHLVTEHNINYDESNTLRKFLLKHINKLRGFQKSQCKKCNEVLRKMCSFNLIKHLSNHDIKIPFEISSMGKSGSSGSFLSSYVNVKYIATSSRDSQPGCSKLPNIDVHDVDRESKMKNMKRVKYDDDKCSPDELPSI